MEERKERIRECSKCGLKMTYIRIKDNQKVCRNCGYIEDLEEVKE